MTEYELGMVRKAIERMMASGAPGISEVMRKAIAGSIIIRLRHELNLPPPALKLPEVAP